MLLKMKMVAVNKHNNKLKILSVEMPNAPDSNRWATFKTTFQKMEFKY
jgi:hypothetical protein